jgi:hypothetical protein
MSIPVHIHGGLQYQRTTPGTLEMQMGTGITPHMDDRTLGTPTATTPPLPQTGTETLQLHAPGRHSGVVGADAIEQSKVIEQIEGTITISRARYLHVWTDLIYNTPDAPIGIIETIDNLSAIDQDDETLVNPDEEAPLPIDELELTPGMDTDSLETKQSLFSFRIQEHRRMRSNEIHYMDHPRIGMFVLATPYELPAPVPPEEETLIETNTSAPVETDSDAATGDAIH